MASPDCARCPFREAGIQVQPTVVSSPKMLVVGESPGSTEELTGRVFSGRTGQFLDRMLDTLHIPRRDLSIGNSVLCRPSLQPTVEEWNRARRCCLPQVQELVDVFMRSHTHRPVILALGKHAQASLIGSSAIFDWCGAPTNTILAEGAIVHSTLHPAFVLRLSGRPYWMIALRHMQRAWRDANGALPLWKWSELVVEVGERAEELLSRVLDDRLPVAVDVETIGVDFLRAPMTAVGIGADDFSVCLPWLQYGIKGGGQSPALESYTIGKRCSRLIKEILARPDIEKTYQNGAFDVAVCARHGLVTKGYAYDLLPAYATAFPATRHDLGFVAAIEYHMERWKTIYSRDYGKYKWRGDPIALRTYCAKDAWSTQALREPSRRRVQEVVGGPALFQNRMRNIHTAIGMTREGIVVDFGAIRKHRKSLRRRARYYRAAFYKITRYAGHSNGDKLARIDKRAKRIRSEIRKFVKDHKTVVDLTLSHWLEQKRLALGRLLHQNEIESQGEGICVKIGSPLSLGKLFEAVLPGSVQARTDSGVPSVDKTSLDVLCSSPDEIVCGLATAVSKFRKNIKRVGIVNGLVPGSDGKIHPFWNPCAAKTDRWAARDPAIMTVPKSLRDIVRPSADGHVLVEADYDGLEARLAAHIYGEKLLLDLFDAGPKWVHHRTAMIAFPQYKAPADVPERTKQCMKTVLYASLYGASVETVYARVCSVIKDATYAEVATLYDKIHSIYGKIFEGQQALLRYIDLHDRVPIPFSGYEIPIYGAYGDLKGEAHNELVNWPIQSSGAALIDKALEYIVPRLHKDDRLILQVHDALVVSTADVKRVAELLKIGMQQTRVWCGTPCTYTVSVKVGSSWGEMKSLQEYLA